ncbi:threonylcarbamoyl-AMP synthase [Oscillibacter valericigenes]|uniref:L-threonylcarbamoyladenylate synthase n=1 Tax=Oscillibacter valericigenes TaxID=351091 RepID=UPI001F204977|nr:L-threonylcarbamoyladenylate synthase [Oscillibacter valericigenes]MCF2617222.1 threonylcarbamoyl-AMP synthase [Oscillibacter valericigenes]
MQTIYYDLRDTKGQQKEIEDKISAAAKILREGGLVGIPTETVYGLAANGLDETAVKRIFEAKGRPQDNPLILTIPGQQWLPRYCKDIPPLAYVLARKFWPGPLTMILKCRTDVVPSIITAGLDTVAMRCPNHPVTLAIIREAGIPVAAPSANTSGRPSCTTAQDVLEDMDGKIEGVVDGGPCTVGVESTILDLTCDPPRLLRPGGLPLEALEQLIGPIAVDKAVVSPLQEGEQPKAPGMKYRHYAPKAPVTVFTGAPEASAREIARRVGPTTGVICFDEFAHLFPQQEVHTLGPSNDKLAQAQRVFDALRTFDNSDVSEILAQCPDSRGLGLAVGNRLKKAAGFHIVESDSQRIVLGLTGGTGAGKTSALNAIRELGGEIIDCDAVYHEMLDHDQELRNTINATFPGVFGPDGKLNRQKLGQEVFAKKERLDKLNAIVFRFLIPELEWRMDSIPDGLYAIDAINLIESGLDRLCDRTIAVTAPTELRVRRIMARDNITEQYARLRISAQKPDEFYRGKCDLELNNAADTPEKFQREAKKFFERLVEALREEKRHGNK